MRFWDGSAWTGQRTWNGSGWVESALAPAPPTRKRNPLPYVLAIAGAATAAVVVVVVIVVANQGDNGKASGNGSRSTTGNSTHQGAGSGTSAALIRWERAANGGKTNVQAIQAVEKDVHAIGVDYGNQADSTTVGADCGHLSDDLLGFPTDAPDAAVSTNLTKAKEYLASGSVDCGADDHAASVELNTAIDFLNRAISRIQSLGG